MALPAWATRWQLWVGALLAVGLFGGGGYWATHGDLWLVNGLDAPVRVSVAGELVDLQAQGRRRLTLPSGNHALEAATADGKGREQLRVSVPSWSGTSVYSVAGAASLYWVKVYYGARGFSAPRNEHEILCGQRHFERKVDLYFEQVPEKISLSKRTKVGTRTALLDAGGGMNACLAMLEAEGKDAAAADMLPAVRAMDPSVSLNLEASLRWYAGDGVGALAVLKGALEEGGSMEDHRAYQHYAELLGRRKALQGEYQARLARDPGNPELKYLAARVLPFRERGQAFRALLQEHPEDPNVRLALAWTLCAEGRHGEALAVLEPLGRGDGLSERDRHRLLSRRVWALAGLGKLAEVAEQVRLASQGPGRVDLELLMAQGRLAAKLGRSDLEPDPKVIDGEGKSGSGDLRRLVYNGVVRPEAVDSSKRDQDDHEKALAEVLKAAATDPEKALGQVHDLTPFTVHHLPDSVAHLLAGEAWRTGDQKAAALLRRTLASLGVDPEVLRAYVMEGRSAEELEELGENRAPFHLARARQLRVEGKAAAAAAEEQLARRFDVYGGPVARALEHWPPVGPGAEGEVQVASAKGPRQQAPAKKPPAQAKVPKTTRHRLVLEEGITLQPER